MNGIDADVIYLDLQDPVVTRCKHYFCEQCALKHNAKEGRRRALCGVQCPNWRYIQRCKRHKQAS